MTARDPIRAALWHIDGRLAEPLSLDEIAASAGVSRFHLARAFQTVIGRSVMGYARARRLSEAAKALAAGAPDILTVALDWGYGSHEAFTRAFRDQFGVTPEQVRAARDCRSLELVEQIKMPDPSDALLSPPRFEEGRVLLLAGLAKRLNCDAPNEIPALWRQFGPHIGHVPGQISNVAYGVTSNGDDAGNADYLCAVEVRDFDSLTEDYARLRLPAQRYAVFTHKGHVSAIRNTWMTIFQSWFPESGHALADAPNFERYAEDFDPDASSHAVEIWLPLKR
ncbi:MAG: AraC family transcriptional regulator [Hydrogenophilaceae bacterium]|jgi:AraC family transcriptional regulator|nr:AraC family transcriptional regulator [Hydrogenophilaceae bacterium]